MTHVTSQSLGATAAELAAMARALERVESTLHDQQTRMRTRLDAIDRHWGGPTATATIGAATDYLDETSCAPAALAEARRTLATLQLTAEELCASMARYERSLASAQAARRSDPEHADEHDRAVWHAQGQLDQLAVAWLETCNAHAGALHTVNDALQRAHDTTPTDHGLPAPVEQDDVGSVAGLAADYADASFAFVRRRSRSTAPSGDPRPIDEWIVDVDAPEIWTAPSPHELKPEERAIVAYIGGGATLSPDTPMPDNPDEVAVWKFVHGIPDIEATGPNPITWPYRATRNKVGSIASDLKGGFGQLFGPMIDGIQGVNEVNGYHGSTTRSSNLPVGQGGRIVTMQDYQTLGTAVCDLSRTPILGSWIPENLDRESVAWITGERWTYLTLVLAEQGGSAAAKTVGAATTSMSAGTTAIDLYCRLEHER